MSAKDEMKNRDSIATLLEAIESHKAESLHAQSKLFKRIWVVTAAAVALFISAIFLDDFQVIFYIAGFLLIIFGYLLPINRQHVADNNFLAKANRSLLDHITTADESK